MDFSPHEIASAVKGVLDISGQIKALKKIPNDIIDDLQTRIIELQGIAMSLNQKMLAMQKEQAELEAENTKLKDWSSEKTRYQLHTRTGFTVYCLRESEISDSEPAHCICPKCYEEGSKSILQVTRLHGLSQVNCPSCGSLGSTTYQVRLP